MNRTSIKLLAFCSIAMSVFTACQSDDVDNDKDNNTAQHIYTIKAESTAAQVVQSPAELLLLMQIIRKCCTLSGRKAIRLLLLCQTMELRIIVLPTR